MQNKTKIDEKIALGISPERQQEIARRKRPNNLAGKESNKFEVEPEDNSKLLRHNLRIYNLDVIDIYRVDEVKARINEYFNLCIEDETKPSVEGLAISLNIDRRTLWQYSNGGAPQRMSVSVTDALKKAYGILNTYLVDLAQNGKLNPVTAIFLMKNNFNYQDKSEVVLTPNANNQEDAENIKNKYLEEKHIIDAEDIKD